jgi:hypothetical protein
MAELALSPCIDDHAETNRLQQRVEAWALDQAPCCACEDWWHPGRHVVLLARRWSTESELHDWGWRCEECGIERGAVALLCDACLEAGRVPENAYLCSQTGDDDDLVPIGELLPLDHNLARHGQLELLNVCAQTLEEERLCSC